MATVLELQRAGFSDEEIANWVNEQRIDLTNAGYNEVEQSNHFGIPFKSKTRTLDSLIGPKNQEDFISPLDENLNAQELQTKEHDYTLQVDNTTKEKKANKIIQYEELLNQNIQEALNQNDNIPYNFNQLEKEAFANKNSINLDIDEKIYDDKGIPVNEDYYKEFTLNENFINKYAGHTINSIQHLYEGTGILPKHYKSSSYILNNVLQHYSKVLSGNESWGARSYSWGEEQSGIFRMSEEQVQTGLNAYIDMLTSAGIHSPDMPYWVAELKNDKDISGLTADAQTALFLAYLSKQPNFAKDFKSLLSMEEYSTANAVNMLINNYLIPQGIKPKELEIIKNRLAKNMEHHSIFTTDEINHTAMQVPTFGKSMPDFISMSGDHLMGGEGRKDAWERGGMQSVTEMAWRLYHELENAEKTGKKIDAVKLIEEFMTEGQRWDKRGIAGIRSIAQDLPWFGLGSAVGAVQATGLAAVTGGATLPASPFIITGNAFALHGALRHALIETYMQNEAEDFAGFWDIVLSKATLKVYGKDFVLGAGVHTGGVVAGKIAGPIIAKSGLPEEYSKWLLSTSKVSGEISMLASLPSVIEWAAKREEYVPPKKEDFIDAAVIIFGLKAGLSGSKTALNMSSKYMKDGMQKLYRLYYQTGKSPKEILKDIEKDETILSDLQNDKVDMPFEYRQRQLEIIKKMNESTGLGNENRIDHIPPPKFYKGLEVKIDAIGKEKGKIIDVGYEGKEHTYTIEKPNGEKIKLTEELVEKWSKEKETEIFKDSKEFEVKQSKGEYESKLEIVKEDSKIFETSHRDSQAFENVGTKKFVSDKSGLASSNSIMMFVGIHYKNLGLELNKIQKTVARLKDKSISDIVKDFIPKQTNEHKVKILFKVNKDNRLGVEKESLVVEMDNRMFLFDLHAYMALKKLNDGKDATLTGHYDTKFSKYNLTGEKYSDAGVLIFRTEKGEIAGLLMSNKPNQKVNNEAQKFKNEFGTSEKEYADTTYSKGFNREPPTWENMNLNKDTEVFRGLEMYDIIKMFKELSEGDTPSAVKMRQTIRGTTLGKMIYTEGGKGRIEINKELFDATNKDYKKNLESILMTLSHELGHYIDFIPNATLARGNILGRLASLKKFMNDWMEGKEGNKEGPFTEKEMNKLRYEAEKTAKALEKKTDKELIDLGFNPKDILKIITDAKAREFLDPAVYEAYAKASTALKKAILKDAMKGKIHPDILSALKSNKKQSLSLKQRTDKILKEMIQKEVIRRGLVGRSEIMIELKKLTQKWKPFNEFYDAKFTKYRYSSAELMADFMMSFLLRPRETQVLAPIAFRTWMNYMNRKPEVLKMWESIQAELNLPKDQRDANIIKDQVDSFRETRMKIFEKMQKESDISDTYDFIRRNVDSVFHTILNYYKKVHEGKMFGSELLGDAAKLISQEKNSKRFKVEDRENVELALERLLYQDTYIERIQNSLYTEVFKPMQEFGINRDIFAVYLQNRWVSKPDGPRSNVLNPKGIEVIKAGELVAKMEKEMPKIYELAERFYAYRQKYVIKNLEKSGVFDPATIELIKNNKEYVSFRIEEYASFKNDSWVTGFLTATKYGTAKEVANVFEATILKDWQLLQIAERNSVVAMVSRFLQKYKTEIENFERKQYRVTDKFPFIKSKKITERTVEPAKKQVTGSGTLKTIKWTPLDKNLDLSKFSLIKWTENGKEHAVYMGKEVAHGFDKINQAYDNMAATNLMYAMNAPYRKMFTEINPTFWSYNIFRDTMRTILNLPKTTAFDLIHGGKNSFLKQMWKSWTPAFRQVMRRDELRQDKDAVEMLDRRLFISLTEKYRSRAGGITEGMPSWMSGDGVIRSIILLKRKPNWKKLSRAELEKTIETAHKEKSIKDLTKAERELAPNLRDTIITKFENDITTDKWLSNESMLPPYYKLVTTAERISRVFERTTKIAAFKHLNKLREEGLIDWTDAQIDYAIRNWAGSPNFLRKGNAATLYNNIFLFGNAAKEEWRGVLEAKRYQGQGAWWGKFLTYGIAPQVIYRAAKYGMLGHAAHLYFNLIGDDVLANNFVVPLGMINDSGEFEFGMKPEAGSLYKVVYLQFPKDEVVKMFGAATWHGYNELYGKLNDNPTKNWYEEMLNGVLPVLDEGTPSFSPFFAAVKNAVNQLGIGDTPKDPFTGLNIYPDKLQDMGGIAGQWERSKAYGKWLWNNSGGLMFYKFDSYYDPYNLENIVTEIEEKLGMPIVGKTVARFLKVSNQGIIEQVWKDIEEGNQINNHYSAVADLAVTNLLGGKELSKSQEEALWMDKGWMERYQTALKYTYGTQFTQFLLTLEGDDLKRAIRKMADIENKLDYNIPFIIKE